MQRIDGGGGGGQLLRWAVAVAALRGEAVEIESIRGARETPGLRPQHVAAVRAVAAFTDADVSGLEVGSQSLTFDPGPVAGGTAALDVGTAGSISLVFDTVLPLALVTEEPIELAVTGGTDVKWSPPIDYLRQVKGPVLADHGLEMRVDVSERGFYPRGGGRATLYLESSGMRRLDLADRGTLVGIHVYSIATEDLRDPEVADRQAETAALELEPLVDVAVGTTVEYVDAASTGSSVLLVARYENTRAGFGALGERGKPSEAVAREAVAAFESFDANAGAVDPHLADQLLPFLALTGGRITTTERTDHIETGAKLLQQFGYEIDVVDSTGILEITAELE